MESSPKKPKRKILHFFLRLMLAGVFLVWVAVMTWVLSRFAVKGAWRFGDLIAAAPPAFQLLPQNETVGGVVVHDQHGRITDHGRPEGRPGRRVADGESEAGGEICNSI